jgi:hypothetical protein
MSTKTRKILTGISLLGIFMLAAPTPLPAGPIVDCVESETYPIDVCWDDAVDREDAAVVLEYADLAWAFEVEELGIAAPWRLDEAGEPEPGLRIEFTDMGWGGGGMVEPLADVPATPRSDCAVVVKIDTGNPGYYLPVVVGHDFAHAVDMSEDCVEPLTESVVPYIEILFAKEHGTMAFSNYMSMTAESFYSAFQQNPSLAVDYVNYMDTTLGLYHWGHALFSMYIDERWGEADGALIADIMEHTRQDGTVRISGYGIPSLASGENEPDLADAIDEVLGGLDGSYWQALKEFSLWRVFTGDLADGAHLQYGEYIPPVAMDSGFWVDDLPVFNQSPVTPPHETGSSYFTLELRGSPFTVDEETLTFALRAAEGENWYLAALIFRDGGATEVRDTDIASGEGSLVLDRLPDATRIVFAVTNLGDLVHDYDERDWTSAGFEFDLTTRLAPVISGIEPGRVEQGLRDVSLTVTGENLSADAAVDLGSGIHVTGLAADEAGTSLGLTVDVDDDAEIGMHPISIAYEAGPGAEMPDALEVVSGQGPSVTSLDPASATQGETVNVLVTGERFRDGASASFSGDGLAVTRTDFSGEISIFLEVSVHSEASPGDRDLTVVNPDGKSFTLPAAFTVLELDPGVDPDPPAPVEEGCGCHLVAGSAGSALPWLLPALLWVLGFALRRKRQP